MFRLAGLLTSLISIISASQNASAQSILDQRNSEAYAGVYVSMPFGTASRKAKEDYKLGFKAGLRQDVRYSRNGLLKTSSFTTDVFDLSFSERGFSKLSLAGTPVVYTDIYGRTFYLGENTGEKSGTSIGRGILWGLGIVAGAGIILAVTIDVTNLDQGFCDGFEGEDC